VETEEANGAIWVGRVDIVHRVQWTAGEEALSNRVILRRHPE